VRFHHHIFPTNLMTNSLKKSPLLQTNAHIFVLFVSQKFVANQIGLLQTHPGNFASKFVIKFVAKMLGWKRTFRKKTIARNLICYLVLLNCNCLLRPSPPTQLLVTDTERILLQGFSQSRWFVPKSGCPHLAARTAGQS
jgi:hypothetical protein